MTKTVSLTEAKKRFPELVEDAIRGESTIITRYGKPHVVLVPTNPGIDGDTSDLTDSTKWEKVHVPGITNSRTGLEFWREKRSGDSPQ